MNMNLLLLALLMMNVASYAQKNRKSTSPASCQLTYDKEIGRDIYLNPDTNPEFVSDTTNEMFWLSPPFQIGPVSKAYNPAQRVKFAYVIEKDGHSSFVKLFYPADDKEIEAEVKRIVSLIPLYKPATCGNEPVISHVDMTIRLYKKEKK